MEQNNKKLRIFLIVLVAVAIVTTLITNYIRRDGDKDIKLMTSKEFKRTAVDLNLTVNSESLNNTEVNESYIATSDLSSINIEFIIFNTNEQAENYYIDNKEGKTKIREKKARTNYSRYEYELDNKQYDLYKVQNTILIISNNEDDSIAKEKIKQFKKSITQE